MITGKCSQSADNAFNVNTNISTGPAKATPSQHLVFVRDMLDCDTITDGLAPPEFLGPSEMEKCVTHVDDR